MVFYILLTIRFRNLDAYDKHSSFLLVLSKTLTTNHLPQLFLIHQKILAQVKKPLRDTVYYKKNL